MDVDIPDSENVRYAAFGPRYRAVIVDGVICGALFLCAALIAGILLERYPGGRIAVFAVVIAAILVYEPFMVSRYGGTIGHRRSNIRVVRAGSDENLPFWRAAIRSVIKQSVGIVSFAFMFVTARAQGLHDLAAGARVMIADPESSDDADYFAAPGGLGRRLLVTAIYNVALLIAFSVGTATVASPACLEQQACPEAEWSSLRTAAGTWLLLAAVSTLLGLAGRLPGCRETNKGE